MMHSTRALLGVALPILTIAVFVTLLAFSLVRLSNVEREMRFEATQNMLWVISRSHIASLALGEVATKFATGETDRVELDLRYNIFLSRLALINDGPQRRQMDALGFGSELDSLAESLSGLETSVQSGAVNAIGQIPDLLAPYNAMLGRAANRAMVAEWDQLGSILDTSRAQLWQIIISLLGISLAGLALFAHILIAKGEARRRTRLLDKEKDLSELLIGSSGEGIIAVDLNRRCTVWNDAAERLFRLSAGSTIGRSLDDLSGFFEIDRIVGAISDAFEARSTALLDQPFFLLDRADPLFIDLRCFSLRDAGRIVGAILLVSDVTKQRIAQREIAQHRDHLEQLVLERTRDLDAALTRERALTDIYRNFGTMISHQFRTPLAIVDSAMQRLIRRSARLSPEEVVKRAGTARIAISRLTDLIENTLDAGRIDAGQIAIRAGACDIGHLAAEICERQSEQLPARQISIVVPSGEPVIAHCDSVHAENILVNLVSNAVKYSPADTPIYIGVSANGNVTECAVTNNGDLDNPIERQSLFDRYFRASNSQGHSGIGVGLYVARSLARLQGGDVELQETAQGEITLVLILPRHQSPENTRRFPRGERPR